MTLSLDGFLSIFVLKNNVSGNFLETSCMYIRKFRWKSVQYISKYLGRKCVHVKKFATKYVHINIMKSRRKRPYYMFKEFERMCTLYIKTFWRKCVHYISRNSGQKVYMSICQETWAEICALYIRQSQWTYVHYT